MVCVCTTAQCFTLYVFNICILFSSKGALAQKREIPERKVARIEGDIMIGALFSVHQSPNDDDASIRKCGEFREEYGIQRVEVMLHTIRRINADPTILPGIKLGCEIRDSCWFPSVALEQSLEFLSDSLSSSSYIRRDVNFRDQCNITEPRKKPIVALVGPGSSTVSIQVQNLMQLFNIPQVAYSATSRDLSDKSIYKTFLRVCPPDTLQAQAMVDIARRYNWTYVSAVYTAGNYGTSGFNAFKDLAKEEGICLATSKEIPDGAKLDHYVNVLEDLLQTKEVHVVVCFCDGQTVRDLLKATNAKHINTKGRFIFIGSDGWANREEISQDFEDQAIGSITIKPRTTVYKIFDDYYFALDPYNNTDNPWFKDFWQERFKCRLRGDPSGSDVNSSWPFCEENLSLKDGYQQDTKMGSVVDAIMTVAYGLHNMYMHLCNGTKCNAFSPVNTSKLLGFLKNVTINSTSGDIIQFNKNGDPVGRYDIYHLVNGSNKSLKYVNIGEWSDGDLVMDDSLLVWNNGSRLPVTSYCSKPCQPGMRKEVQNKLVECCWSCVPCSPWEYLLNETTCKLCPEGERPVEDRSGCEKILVVYLKWSDSQAIIAVALAIFGLTCTAFVIVTFFRYNNTPIVKASSRENSYILLVGILLCYGITFPFIARPGPSVCYLQRIGLGLSFCLCYSALVVRTNRMARILAGSKKKILTRKPRFLSSTAQVVMTLLTISVEVAIIVGMLIVDPPEAKIVNPQLETGTARLICNSSHSAIIAPLCYDAFLVAVCTLYAFKTRNLPENFNEAKYIAFTMYTTCVVWLAFVPLYVTVEEMREIVVCFAVSISATVALACLFFPKTYIILFKPERNRRSSMTTSTIVRMHVGGFYDSSYNSVNGNYDLSREKLIKNNSIRQKHTLPERQSLFSSLRRRNGPTPSIKRMKAYERDLKQRKRMPLYRYSSSSPQPSPSMEIRRESDRDYTMWSDKRDLSCKIELTKQRDDAGDQFSEVEKVKEIPKPLNINLNPIAGKNFIGEKRPLLHPSITKDAKSRSLDGNNLLHAQISLEKDQSRTLSDQSEQFCLSGNEKEIQTISRSAEDMRTKYKEQENNNLDKTFYKINSNNSLKFLQKTPNCTQLSKSGYSSPCVVLKSVHGNIDVSRDQTRPYLMQPQVLQQKVASGMSNISDPPKHSHVKVSKAFPESERTSLSGNIRKNSADAADDISSDEDSYDELFDKLLELKSSDV